MKKIKLSIENLKRSGFRIENTYPEFTIMSNTFCDFTITATTDGIGGVDEVRDKSGSIYLSMDDIHNEIAKRTIRKLR